MASSSAAAAPAHPWEAEGYGSSDEESMRPEEVAAHHFLDILMELYLQSKVSARNMCEMCFWAEKAGMPE
eukprot:7661245-Alexandrium_andersonii.AAC.1